MENSNIVWALVGSGMSHVLTDEELEPLYSNHTIVQIDWRESGDSGWVSLELPEGVDNGDYQSITDEFIIYEHNGKMAFGRWYPEAEYLRLCEEILKTRPPQIS